MQRLPPAYYLAFNIFMWGEYIMNTGSRPEAISWIDGRLT